MPPVPAPPVEPLPAAEVPATAMAPPPMPMPPMPPMPPRSPEPLEVAPCDEVARPFVDFGQPSEGRSTAPGSRAGPPRRGRPDRSVDRAHVPDAAPAVGAGCRASAARPAAPADAPPAVTADGLVKRVPGARLAAGLQSRSPRSTNGGPQGQSGGFEPPRRDVRRQHNSSMLSRFQAMQRDGRAAAEAADDPPDPEEPS